MSANALIGVLSDTPKACGDRHLPGCFNPTQNRTWCICGEQTWEGNHGCWVSRRLWSSPGREAKLLGYDVYYLPPTGGKS